MAFDPITSPVDFIVLSGKRSPGLATVSGSALMRQIDERKGFGSIGATTIVRGQKISPVVVKIRLFTKEHFAAWPEFRDLVKRNPRTSESGARTGSISPFDIEHPLLEEIGIRSVVLESLGQAEQTTEDGEWTYTIGFKEYRRPRLALASTDGSTNEEPTDPVDREIARLTRQVERLAAAE